MLTPYVEPPTFDGMTRNVNWTFPAGEESEISSFRVEFREVGAPSWTDNGTVSKTLRSKAVGGLAVGITYEFRVSAIPPSGPAVFSNVFTYTALITAPTIVSVD